LELEPDLAAATFTGTVTIALDVLHSTRVLTLNAIELAIGEVTVGGVAQRHELDEATERLSIHLESPAEPGPLTLTIAFTGVLNDKLRGFYRSTFTGADGNAHVIATTQLQSTDARRAFPCWDEPDLKAVFGITVTHRDGLLAVSNGAESSARQRPDGSWIVRFADTLVMSTYLVAIVVGPLQATPPVDVNGTPMRIVHVPGKGHLTSFGLEVGAFALDWFEKYYGIPYPAEKVDLIALPDFAAGAMENLGCITFRENLLLLDPLTSTQAELQNVADVVSHELAHMWFGDLVTMRWWNGIWLNEAFATFMEVEACDAFRPSWKRWEYFSMERSAAFEIDSLDSTRSVEFEVRSPQDSEGMFDILTYQKGGALLRMLQQYLGAERFRHGVRRYLHAHSFANTETSDLWDAIEESSGEPIRKMMDSWIWQPGYPLISAALHEHSLIVRQERCSFASADQADGPNAAAVAPIWLVPIHIQITSSDGAVTTRKILLDSDETTIVLDDAASTVMVNAGGYGFYRVTYDAVLRSRLAGPALRALAPIERYNLVDDAWAAVIAGRLHAADFLAFAEGFAKEDDLYVWQAIAAGLRGLGRLLDDDSRPALQHRVLALAKPALARLGWEGADGEDELTAKLRGLLVGLVAVLANDATSQEQARALFEQAFLDPAAVNPELVSAATLVVAATGTAADFDRFVERFRAGATPQEQIRYLMALGDFDDADLIQRACEFAVSGEVKTQNAPFLLSRAIANRTHGAAAWKFVREHWAHINKEFPSNTIVRMVDPVKLLNGPADVADVAGFFSEHPIPQGAKTLSQILERQRVNAALRSREADTLAAALGS
jgi:puromycin-sensitive aminopeptidase